VQRIVVVDDAPVTLEIYRRALNQLEDVSVEVFTSSIVAFAEVCEHEPDLIVVDYRMPDLDGLEFVERFRKRSSDPDIPMIVVTGSSDADVRRRALDVGATDFIQKPADSVEFMSRSRNLLRLRAHEKALRQRSVSLEAQVKELSGNIHELEMLDSMITLAGYHDNDGRFHGARLGDYASLMARKMGLDVKTQRLVYLAAPLHDIGKIAIPDRILFKNGKLTKEEFAMMKTHSEIGYEILRGGTSLLMTTAAQIARSHHECWDGTGYPQGLKGEDIPLLARIVAVADVFDALVSVRPYKSGWALPQAFEAIRRGLGSKFDPRAGEAFLDSQLEIQEIRQHQMTSTSAA